MKRKISTQKGMCIIFLAIFAFMLICNILTLKIADDYSYSFSFATGERIANLKDIFISLKEHAVSVNGRLIAHFFAHFFLMLPSIVFDIVNTLMFVLQIFLICKICKVRNDKFNIFVLVTFFCMIWMYVPAFGQVYLWLDGACNYLWSIVLGLLYIIPYMNEFCNTKSSQKTFSKICFVFFSFFMGGYLENSSPAFIAMSIIFVALCRFYQHKKVQGYQVSAIIVASIGYIGIYLSPAQWQNKSDGFGFGALRQRFINALNVYKNLTALLVFFVILLVIAISVKIQIHYIIVAIVFFVGSVCSNFIMILALYYPERCAICPTILLITAVGVLMVPVLETRFTITCRCGMAILLLLTTYEIFIGANDIYETFRYMQANETIIVQERDSSATEVRLLLRTPETKYSVLYGLVYLSGDQNADVWPNCHMAKYYGVESIKIE